MTDQPDNPPAATALVQRVAARPQEGMTILRASGQGARWWLAARDWPLWELPGWLAAFVIATVAAYALALAAAVPSTTYRARDSALAGVLLVLGAASIELTGRSAEPAGYRKDILGVWLLPTAVLLPPVYVMAALIPAMWLLQMRSWRNLVHRRVFSTAAQGLSYGAGSLAFHAITGRPDWLPARGTDWPSWLLALGCCVLIQRVLNTALVMTAAKGADRSLEVRHLLFSREPLYNDLAEMCVGSLVAIAATSAVYLVLLALPLASLLQRSLHHAQLASASRLDAKTGLLNAVTWQREARIELTRATRTCTPLALAMIDIDHFKRVNDTYGHLAGDAVLTTLAATIRAVLRDYDLIGRFGGEEFCVLLPHTTAAEATSTAERLRGKLAQLIVPAGPGPDPAPLQVTVSIGVAMLESARRDLDELIAAADTALYHAKQSGRNRVHVMPEGSA
jgi:diguanylate cyclase (GGDEF)-like protein